LKQFERIHAGCRTRDITRNVAPTHGREAALSRQIEPEQTLRKMEDASVVLKRFEIALRTFGVLDPADLRLIQTQPSTKKLLAQWLSEQLKMARMVPERFEDLSDVPARESCPELVRLEEVVPELDGWGTKLVTLLSMTPAAETRGVVIGKRSSTTCAARVVGSALPDVSSRVGHALLPLADVGPICL
jgi:hypothetical protein